MMIQDMNILENLIEDGAYDQTNDFSTVNNQNLYLSLENSCITAFISSSSFSGFIWGFSNFPHLNLMSSPPNPEYFDVPITQAPPLPPRRERNMDDYCTPRNSFNPDLLNQLAYTPYFHLKNRKSLQKQLPIEPERPSITSVAYEYLRVSQTTFSGKISKI